MSTNGVHSHQICLSMLTFYTSSIKMLIQQCHQHGASSMRRVKNAFILLTSKREFHMIEFFLLILTQKEKYVYMLPFVWAATHISQFKLWICICKILTWYGPGGFPLDNVTEMMEHQICLGFSPSCVSPACNTKTQDISIFMTTPSNCQLRVQLDLYHMWLKYTYHPTNSS